MTAEKSNIAERLAELTGRPVEEFEFDGEVPDFADQEVRVRE